MISQHTSVCAQQDSRCSSDALIAHANSGFLISAFLVCDRIGRINATRLLCTLWIVGIVVFMIGGVKNSLGAIYAGRLIAGLGVGQTPVVG